MPAQNKSNKACGNWMDLKFLKRTVNICDIFTFSNISENQSRKRFREIRQQPCAIKKHPVLDSSKQGLLLWSS